MVSKRAEDGDLFPRGAAPDATPRIHKRNGEVLFAPESKRRRENRQPGDDSAPPKEAPVARAGTTLTYKRTNPGMTILALVMKTSPEAIEFLLPDGLRGVANDDTLLPPQSSNASRAPLDVVPATPMVDDVGDSDESSSDSDSDPGEDSFASPPYVCVKPGQILPVCVTEREAKHKGRICVAVSLKPELINHGLNPSHLLRKNFPSYAVVRSIEDHGYILSFGSNIQNSGFLPFDRAPPPSSTSVPETAKDGDDASSETDDEPEEEARLAVGTPLLVLTRKNVSVKKKLNAASAVIRVSGCMSDVLPCAVDVLESASFQDIRAGMLLRGRVMNIGPGGVSLLAFGVFPLSVDAAHVPRKSDGSWDVEADKVVAVRVLYADASVKTIVGSMLSSFIEELKPRPLPVSWTVGTLLKPLEVETVRGNYGLVLRMSKGLSEVRLYENAAKDSDDDETDDGEDKMQTDEDGEAGSSLSSQFVPIFVHIKHVQDGKLPLLENTFKPGTVIDSGGRIVFISKFDGVAVVDMRRSVLSRKALSYEEIEVGTIYDCRIVRYVSEGIVVAVEGDHHLEGFIPQLHVSDVHISPARYGKHEKLRIGATLQCRALNIKLSEKRTGSGVLTTVYLTARASLLSPKYPIITSFESTVTSLQKGLASSSEKKTHENVYTGTAGRVTPSGGLIVRFFNGISGFVPAQNLCISSTSGKAEDIYPEGETVHARVCHVDVRKRNIVLSMQLQAKEPVLNLGEEVSGQIIRANEKSKLFIVSVPAPMKQRSEKGKKEAQKCQTIECHLPFGHLSDSPKLSDRLATEISQAICLAGNTKSKPIDLVPAMVLGFHDDTPLLTCKPSLLSSRKHGQLPSSSDELKVIQQLDNDDSRRVLRGYVKAVMPHFVLIGFLGKLVGVVQKRNVADRFVHDCSRLFQVHQSVPCVLDSYDDSKMRLHLDLRTSKVGTNHMTEDLQSLFSHLRAWQSSLKKTDVESSFPIGLTTPATKTSEDNIGLIYTLTQSDSTATGVVLSIEQPTSDISPVEDEHGVKKVKGKTKSAHQQETHNVRVIDVDPFSGVIDLTKNDRIVNGAKCKSKLSVGSSCDGEILLVKDTHLVLGIFLPNEAVDIAFALPPATSDALTLRPGTKLQCTIVQKRKRHGRTLVHIDNIVRREREGLTAKNGKNAVVNKLKALVHQEKTTYVGMAIPGKVSKLHGFFAYIAIGPGCVGHLHLTNTSFVTEKKRKQLPLGPVSDDISSDFALPTRGEKTSFFVIDAKSNEQAEQEEQEKIMVELCLDKRCCEQVPLIQGSKVLGIVRQNSSKHSPERSTSKKQYFTMVSVGRGRNQTIFCHDVDCLGLSGENLKVGSLVNCLITETSDDGTWVRGALSGNGSEPSASFKAIVSNVAPGRGLSVTLPSLMRNAEGVERGFVDICDVSDDFDKAATLIANMREGDEVFVRKVEPTSAGEFGQNIMQLTMRSKEIPIDRLLLPRDVKKLEIGSKVRGFVRKTGKNGCFVNIGRGVSAHVKMCDLDDDYINDPEECFPPGKLVCGKVDALQGDKTQARVSLTFRKRERKDLLTEPSKHDLKEGMICDGTVKKIDRWGCIVELSKGVSGILHVSEVDQDRTIHEPLEEWVSGQRLTVVVINVNQRLSLGTKRCYFEAAGLSEIQVDEVLEKNLEAKTDMIEGKTPATVIDLDTEEAAAPVAESKDTIGTIRDGQDAISVDEGEESGGNESLTPDEDSVVEVEPTIPALNVPERFDFADNALPSDEDRNDEEVVETEDPKDEEHKRSSKDKREKRRLREAAENEIRLREEALARDENAPETAEDYERMLVAQPNSSVLWIRYMAFCLQISQVERARSIAERALDTISLEKEVDRTNVWVAYINMEARFGAMNDGKDLSSLKEEVKRDAAVFRVFDRGCQRITDVKNFHLQVAAALRDSHPKLADEILRRAARKFKDSKKVWISIGQTQFAAGNVAEARRTLERAIAGTEKRKHIPLITKFAQLEFKFGSSEHGRTMLGSLVGNFPKRVDLWNIYFDMEIGQCKRTKAEDQKLAVGRTRRLFEQFTALDLSVKKIKFGFKKWQEFEKAFGGSEERKEVKVRAQAWVNKALNSRKE